MRVVHYINQFFGQVGGETAANFPLEVREGTVALGNSFNAELKGKAEIVATIICGDNYFVENTEEASKDVIGILEKHKADLLIAGPAFNAGRYGMACGEVCRIAQQILGITAVTGMFKENPAVDMYKRNSYIFPTSDSARGMKEAVKTISDFVIKVAEGKKIQGPDVEGYYPRGIRKNIFVAKTGAQRAVDMALDKVHGRPFKTELEMPKFTKVIPSKPVKDIKNATIALMTTGGIVPKGNPDRMEACFCTKYKKYNIQDFGGLTMVNCEVAHGGYDPTFGNENANRILPVEIMMNVEKQGKIGKLYPYFYVTVGNGMAVDKATAFGQAIGKEILEEGAIDGVILTSTWGTDTRCGATIVKQIDSMGIPVVHICTIVPISKSVGANRILPGVSIPHPTGNPKLTPEEERNLQMSIIESALKALETEISEQKIFQAGI